MLSPPLPHLAVVCDLLLTRRPTTLHFLIFNSTSAKFPSLSPSFHTGRINGFLLAFCISPYCLPHFVLRIVIYVSVFPVRTWTVCSIHLFTPRAWFLACCSPWGRQESDTTEQLNTTSSWYSINICWTNEWMDDLSCVSRIPSPIWLVFFLQHIDIPRPFSSQKSKFSFDPLAIILSLASQDQLSERVIQTCYLHSFTTQLYPSTKSTLVKVTSYLLVAKKMIVFHHCLIYPLPHLTSWTCLLSWISFFPGKTLPP